MSIINYDEEEEVFTLSFAYTDGSAHMSRRSSLAEEFDSFEELPPPLLAENVNGLELSDTELDDEISYQQQLIGSPLLYTSERLIKRPTHYNKESFLIELKTEESIPMVDTSIDFDILDLSDDFANAAQQNYRLWLQSV